MKLMLLERARRDRTSGDMVIDRDGATLRVRNQPERTWEPRLIHGGAQAIPAVQVQAEIQAKRFSGDRVVEDRYAATFPAADTSPASLMQALAAAIANISEFSTAKGSDERLVLQISLVG